MNCDHSDHAELSNPVKFNIGSDDEDVDDGYDDVMKCEPIIDEQPSVAQYLQKARDVIAVRGYETLNPSAEEVASCTGAAVRLAEIHPDIKRTVSREKGLSEEFNLAINTFQENEFDMIHSTPPIKRSISLKPLRQPTHPASSRITSPGRRKTVRFADALGLDLASVRHIVDPDEPPVVKFSVLHKRVHKNPENAAFWKTNFQQPAVSTADFLRKLSDRKVLLESCSVDNRDLRIHGIVRVLNLAFEKKVVVRYTEDEWKTFREITANYVNCLDSTDADKFYFFFNLPRDGATCEKVEFAVRYDVSGETYWDSNLGYNYSIQTA